MKKNKKIVAIVVPLVMLIALALVFQKFPKKPVEYIHNEGKAQGTYYSAIYQQPDGVNLQPKIDSIFNAFDLSLSTYLPTSIISRINNNDSTVTTDSCFEAMYEEARIVSEKTNGAFDITVAPLVNAWGFGFKEKDSTKFPDVKEFLPLIGYKKVKLENHKIIKQNPGIMLDASAIAQGLSADIIGRMLEKNGCQNYLIDIGGEIVCKGVNPDGKNWQIGVDKPVDDPENANGELQTILSITNLGVTTSGNYRKFYYQGGKKYAHTINPATGYPVSHNLLSATVIAPNCMQADAYATAFMVVGVDSAMAICRTMPEMECYLIYSDEKGNFQVTMTAGFKKYIAK